MTHGSLFDGFGGMRRGLEDAGFNTRWRIDLLDGRDITTESPDDYERVDLISGGPPCQRGSHAAGFHGDTQSGRTFVTRWPEMLRFIDKKRPTWVLVENVPGFVPEMVGWTHDLQRMGYGCSGRLVDSRHWLPQQRTRAFLVGRMGTDGLALRDHLYAGGIRVEGFNRMSSRESRRFTGSCSDCLRGGIFARLCDRKSALMGAGNAVSQPVAKWIGRRIIEAEAVLNQEKGIL